jgi:hypothetical protein
LSIKRTVTILLLSLLGEHLSYAQDSTRLDKIISFPDKLINSIHKKTSQLTDRLDSQTEKYLQKLARKEEKLNRKLAKLDSSAAKALFANSQQQYASFIAKMKDTTGSASGKISGEYLPYLDSLKGGLSFLQQDKAGGKLLQGGSLANVNSTLSEVNQLQDKLQNAESVKQFIRERRQQIKDALSRYTNLPSSIKNSFGEYNKQAYYYFAQVNEYKEVLKDPDKLEQKALSLINQSPAFQEFMKSHSELAGLLSLPVNYSDPQGLVGLQTRDQVQQMITSQMGGGANAGQQFGQQVQAAEQQLNVLKEKLGKLGGGSADIEMSYKAGWGKDIQHIVFTSEGIGLRSYADVKMKGSLYVSGGFEYNYQQPFNSLMTINSFSKWSNSGLIGISKVVSLKTKVFKKTKLQLLWDFLSYEQRPVQQPFKFRVGYTF